MRLRTSININSVQSEITAQLEKMRAAGVPMVHIEKGKVIEVRVLDKSPELNPSPNDGFLTAAE